MDPNDWCINLIDNLDFFCHSGICEIKRTNCDASWETPSSEFLTRSDTNQAVQTQKMARVMKYLI